MSRITTLASMLTLLLFLTACAGGPPRQPVSLSSVPCSPPTDLMVEGQGPRDIPHRKLTPKEIIALWGRDRNDLIVEVERRNDLSDFVATICK